MTSGVGPRIRMSLLERFGSPEAVLAAAPETLRGVDGVGPKLLRAILRPGAPEQARQELDHCRKLGIHLIAIGDEPYPNLLQEIPDPPGVLYVRGELQPRDGVAVAIVGSRRATSYGRRIAESLASGLARAGVTVISGLARGVDAAAHEGALKAGGRTIAVMAQGLSQVYPPEHKNLADDVAACGALLSENPLDAQPMRGSFPQRNRLISGLSMGVIVVEATTTSGAMTTARHAMEQGREVMAVPGPVDRRTSRGCHRLLRDGALLVETVDDVLEGLGPLIESTPLAGADDQVIRHPAELQLNDQERIVLNVIETEPTSIDDIVSKSGLPVHRVLSTVSVLEMRRLVRRVSGNLIVRV